MCWGLHVLGIACAGDCMCWLQVPLNCEYLRTSSVYSSLQSRWHYRKKEKGSHAETRRKGKTGEGEIIIIGSVYSICYKMQHPKYLTILFSPRPPRLRVRPFLPFALFSFDNMSGHIIPKTAVETSYATSMPYFIRIFYPKKSS
jgi:hypothetical protein